MMIRAYLLITLGCVVILVNSAAIDNSVYTDEPRINTGDELIFTIMDKCFYDNTMLCLKEKVLTYLDIVSGLRAESGRNFEEQNIDKVIFDRIGRILSTHEIKVQLPETVFQKSIVSYRADRGIDVEYPKEEGRGGMLKKKLLLPVLLLLKLKMKALMPILVAVIGLKAMKALILSKIAISLVLGFLIYNLVQKLGGLKMSMMPMMPTTDPMTAYGPPAPTTPSSSYEPSWEPNGGPYSRVWEPSNASSGQSLAYSAYYPSSSSSGSSSSSSSLGSSSSPSNSASYSYTS